MFQGIIHLEIQNIVYHNVSRFITMYHKDLSNRKIFIHAFQHMIVCLSFLQKIYCDIITQ